MATPIKEQYPCNDPSCENSADENVAVWWTKHGSFCSQDCAENSLRTQKVRRSLLSTP